MALRLYLVYYRISEHVVNGKGGRPSMNGKDAIFMAFGVDDRIRIFGICAWSLTALSNEQYYSARHLQKRFSNMNAVAVILGIPMRTYVNYEILTIYPGFEVVTCSMPGFVPVQVCVVENVILGRMNLIIPFNRP